MTDVIGEQGAAIDGVANPDATKSRLGGAGHLKNAIAVAIANGTANASASRLGAQGRIFALAGGGDIYPGGGGGGGSPPAWSPLSLFASSEQGVWYDPSDFSTMFQDSAGTTPVTAVGDPVGKILDKSGRGNHATQATAASRPVLRQDGSGYYYLEFDGVDDSLATAAIDFSVTTDLTLADGFVYGGTSRGQLVELTANATNAVTGFFGHRSPESSTVFSSFRCSPNLVETYFNTSDAFSIGNKKVNLAVFNDAGTTSATRIPTCRVNAASAAGSYTGANGLAGTGFANDVLYIGSRAGSSQRLKGGIYSLIVRGAAPSGDDIANTEAYVNSKTGAY